MNDGELSLTKAQRERLAILIEEAGEIVHVGGKILRHGYVATAPNGITYSNKTALENELGDLIEAVDRMCKAKDLDTKAIMQQADTKKREPYLNHQ